MSGRKYAELKRRELEVDPEQGKPIIMVSVSGGKDSLAMWLALWEAGVPNLVPIYADMGWDWESCRKGIEQCQDVTGIQCIVVDMRQDFIDGLKDIGWPLWTMRWCSGLKRDRIRFVRTQIKRQYPGHKMVNAIGIAADEKQRFGVKNLHSRGTIMPLIDLKITCRAGLDLCLKYGIDWGGHYLRWDRLSCWCCPFQKKDDLRRLFKYFPEKWEVLKKLDKVAKEGYKFQWARKDIRALEKIFTAEEKANKVVDYGGG